MPRAWGNAWSRHGRSRAGVVAVAAAVGAAAGALAVPPPERSEEGVAQLLGDATGGSVQPDGYVWERSGGILGDFLVGRRVLFVATRATERGRETDLYRARVRVTPQGQPLGVFGTWNLTETPLGHEEQLVARGARVAFATRTEEGISSVTVLDLEAAEPVAATAESRWLGGLRALDRWLDHGGASPLGRIDTTFGSPPPDELRMELTDADLVLAVGSRAVPAAVSLGEDVLARTSPDAELALHAYRVPVAAWSSPWGAQLAELAQGTTLPEPGDAGGGEALGVASVVPAPPTRGSFPPPGGEPTVGWELRRGPGGPSELEADSTPPFATARVDDARGEPVALVAIDMRQVSLAYAAGYESPRPTAGPRGSGELDRSIPRHRIVGAFFGQSSGAWAPEHGVRSQGVLLSPPTAGLPTVAVREDGLTAMGRWPTGDAGAPPLTSFRQGGAAPSEEEPGADDEGPLVSLCATADGHLIHAYARSSTPRELASVGARVGCVETVPLGAAGAAIGVEALSLRDDGGFDAVSVHPDVPSAASPFEGPFPTEVFYLVAPDTTPKVRLPDDARWLADGGRQPEPSWIPSIHRATITNLGTDVELYSFAPGHFQWDIAVGAKERKHRMGGGFRRGADLASIDRAIASIRIGNGRRKRTRGLAIDGDTGHRFRGDAGTLWVDGERLEVRVSREGFEPGTGDATELPMTADHGQPTSDARTLGPRALRGALCALEDGTVLIAQAVFDSNEATTRTLIELGCDRVVALDRGTHDDAEMWRAGGPGPIETAGNVTTLFVYEVPMRGRVVALTP